MTMTMMVMVMVVRVIDRETPKLEYSSSDNSEDTGIQIKMILYRSALFGRCVVGG